MWCVEFMSCMLNYLIFDLFGLDLGKCLNLCFERLVSGINSLKPFGIKNNKGKVPN